MFYNVNSEILSSLKTVAASTVISKDLRFHLQEMYKCYSITSDTTP